MVEEYGGRHEHSVPLPVIPDPPEASRLRCSVGGPRGDGSGFVDRELINLAEHFGGAGLVEC